MPIPYSAGVYFLQCPYMGLVKIGRSEMLASRLTPSSKGDSGNLFNIYPEAFVIGWVETTDEESPDLEKYLHESFAHVNVPYPWMLKWSRRTERLLHPSNFVRRRGFSEWFMPIPEVIAFIREWAKVEYVSPFPLRPALFLTFTEPSSVSQALIAEAEVSRHPEIIAELEALGLSFPETCWRCIDVTPAGHVLCVEKDHKIEESTAQARL